MATDDKLKYPNYGAMVRAQPPLMQTVGQGTRSVADAGMQAAKNLETTRAGAMKVAGALANQAPKVLGVPAAGIANAVAKGVANFQTGFTGDTYKPQRFEAKSFTDMFGGQGVAPSVPTTVAPVVKPAAAAEPEPQGITTPVDTGPRKMPPGARWVEDTTSDLAKFRQAQMGQAGTAAPAAPTAINVSRQANGNLSFSGVGGGDGTGAVTYGGLPSWTSAKGGAGQGSVGGGFNLAEQNAKMAATLQGIQEFDRQKKVDTLTDAIASGAGGAVGVAQNKIALAGFSDILKQQMAGKSNAEIAKLTAETQRRGQDLGLQGEMARVAGSKYGVDVGAQTAAAQTAVDEKRIAAAAKAATANKTGANLKALQEAQTIAYKNQLMSDFMPDGKTMKTVAQREADMLKLGRINKDASAFMYGAMQSEAK